MPPLRRPGMRKAKLVSLLLFFLAGSLATSPAPAQKVPQVQPPKSDTADLPKIEFEKYKLPNGLEVILSEDHRDRKSTRLNSSHLVISYAVFCLKKKKKNKKNIVL